MCVLATSLFAVSISGVFCAIYWDMWREANDYNEKISESSSYSSEISAYDRCGAVPEIEGDKEDLSTGWSTILAFNSILYLGLSVFTLLCFIGAACQPLICGAVLGHCCGGCA